MKLGVVFSTELTQECMCLTLCIGCENGAIEHFPQKALSFWGQQVKFFLSEGGMSPFHPLKGLAFAANRLTTCVALLYVNHASSRVAYLHDQLPTQILATASLCCATAHGAGLVALRSLATESEDYPGGGWLDQGLRDDEKRGRCGPTSGNLGR